MTTIQILGWVALGVLAGVVLLAAASRLILLLLKGPLEKRIAAKYGPDEILLKDWKANSFGLESKGVWQVRGNGALVLTKDCLHFFLFLPNRELRIPLPAITEVTFTKHHLGKATLYDLLKVRFSGEDQLDSIAWFLSDPTAWKEKIEKIRAEKHGNESR